MCLEGSRPLILPFISRHGENREREERKGQIFSCPLFFHALRSTGIGEGGLLSISTLNLSNVPSLWVK
jgi:hypothetical protein